MTGAAADWAVLAGRLAAWPGHRLMTVMAYSEGHSRRVWSSLPDLWPAGGGKALPADSELYRILIEQGRPRLLDGDAAIAAAFADHALIRQAGCGCAINMPLRLRGRTVGAINLLHAAGQYAGLDMARLAGLTDPAAAWLDG